MMDCYSCLSTSGVRRISPGPTIYEGKYWLVEHAYPCGIKGWLVLVLKRHLEAIHDLSEEEADELAHLQRKSAHILHTALQCQKEYMACFAEAEHFHHVHVHVIARPFDMPEELRGPGIFRMLKVTNDESISRTEIAALCEQLRDLFAVRV